MSTLPLVPELVVPDLNDMAPLTPFVPALDDPTTTAPLDVAVPAPVVSDTAPPLMSALLPDATDTSPPTPPVAVPPER